MRMKLHELEPGKHGRGTGGATPASDEVGRGDAQGTPLPARPAASGRVGPRGSHVVFTDARRREPIRLRRAPTRADTALTRSDASRFGPTRAGIGRYRPKQPIPAEIQKKKKKKPRTHRLLNSNPTSAQMHSKRQKHSSHYISLTLLSALVAL